jgi:hypothetical protein
MKDRKFKNQDLDEIGRSLLKAGVMRADDVERIVSKPELFASIRARIGAEDAGTQPAGWRMQFALSGGFAAAAVAAVLLAFVVLGGDDTQPEIVYVVEPPPEAVGQEISSPAAPAAEPAPSAPAEVRPQRSYRPESVTAKVFRRKETPRAAQPEKQEKAVDLGEFYALAHVPNVPEAAADAQVVRVEVPRASLVALGINLPLDNTAENIKTDLLVGADGVPRAIRLVE